MHPIVEFVKSDAAAIKKMLAQTIGKVPVDHR